MAEAGGGAKGLAVGAAVMLLIALARSSPPGLPLAVALFGLGFSASLIGVLAAFSTCPTSARIAG